MLRSGGDDINAGRIDAAVSENIRKLGNILFDAVKDTGEQVPQVMGEHLLRVDIRLRTQGFHLPPDVGAADGLTCAGHKDHTAFDS